VAASSSGIDIWKTTNSGGVRTLADDHNNDGVSNLVDYAVAGEDPTVGNASIAYALTPGTPAKNFLRLQVLSN
jgi:hypothetical protein